MKPFSEMSWQEMTLTLLVILFARTIIFAGGSTLWIAFSGWAKKHMIDLKDNHKLSLLQQILRAALILLLDVLSNIIAISSGFLILTKTTSTFQFWGTFVGVFIWAEIFFYYSHRWMHQPKYFWLHKYHHMNRPTNPWTSLAFSFSERFILTAGIIGSAAVVSQWVPLSIDGFSLYFLTNYILNVYAHLNVETLPTSFAQKVFGSTLNTTTYHALHHMRYNGHYGLFTRFLDRWNKTEFSDYWSVHEQARHKNTIN